MADVNPPHDPNPTADASGSDAGATSGVSRPSELLENGTWVCDRYTVTGHLGEGGMGVVYRATDTRLNRSVALKFVRGNRIGIGDDELLDEGTRMAGLRNHSNIVVVYDAQRYEGQVCLVLQYVEGGTLRQWERKPHDWREIVAVYAQAGEGLVHLHQQGFIHRDFKAENVLLDEAGRPHVSDFGLALSAAARASRPNGAKPTRGSGTPGHMPPEQVSNTDISEKSDQFAFCVALYRGLYGQLPYGTELSAPLPPLPQPPGARVPRWVHGVLARGLKERPEDRFGSMRELLQALADDPARRRRSWALAGLSVVALAALVAGGAWIANRATAERRECEARVASTWEQIFGEARRQRISAAFVKANAAGGAADFERVRARLEPEAKSWRELSAEACRLPAQGKKRMQSCLEERRQTLQTISTMFASADERIEENALSTVLSEVVPSAACLPGKDHVEVADARLTATDDPLDEDLAKARMLLVAGKYDDAIEETFIVVDEATRADQATVRAEANLLLGEVFTELRRLDADVYLREAIRLADIPGNDLLRTRAHLIYATWWANRGESHFVDANQELREAEAILQRMGGNPLLSAQAIRLKGRLASLNGQHEVAEKHYREALDLLRQLVPAEHPLIAKVKINLALELPPDQAVPALKEVLGSLEALYGNQHPEVASVWHNIGYKCSEAKDWACALDADRKAIAIRERSRSYDPARLGHTRSDLAEALAASGSLEEALSVRELAIEDLVEAQADPEDILRELNLKLELQKKLGRSKTEQDATVDEINKRSGTEAKPKP